MKIDRRNLISLIIGFAIAITSPTLLSLAQRKYLTPTRKRSLPFFLGWYESIWNNDGLTELSPKGINLLMPYVYDASGTAIKAYLDAAAKMGLKILLELPRPIVESGNTAAVRNFIRTYKNHPAVYAWYLSDEPEIKTPSPLSPALLTKVYQAIKIEDASKLVAINFGDVDKIASYSTAMDIIMWDWYPCEQGVPEFQWAGSYSYYLNKVFAIANANKKKFLNVLQAYGEGQFNNRRLPTEAEFRYLFYSSVLTGADGLLFWMHNCSSPAWNKSVLYPTIKEFRAYISAIKGLQFSKPAQRNLSNLLPIPNRNKFLMIAINHTETKFDYNTKLSLTLAGKAVSINQEIVAYISSDNSLNVVLSPYEVRLYEIG